MGGAGDPRRERGCKMNRMLRGTAVILVLFLTAPPMEAEPVSVLGMQDIGELYVKAKNSFDLSTEDAVLLFKGEKVFWLPDGRLERQFHRIVWISTDFGIEEYADLRVPFDSERQELEVVAMRVWRLGDGEIIESGPASRVETLPFQVATAYDYANMREMMLLHDGVELPCVIETAYTIIDREPWRGGIDGLWTFAHNDPTLLSFFVLGTPKGRLAKVFASAGVPAAEKGADEKRGLDLRTWKMENLREIPEPQTLDHASYVPHVTWSTWDSWQAYGERIEAVIESAMVLDDVLRDSLANLLADKPPLLIRAKRIEEFIERSVMYVDYPEDYWRTTPRPAHRTYATAYGHRLDRAVLAAALFKQAGFEVRPVFRGKGYGNVDEGIATVARMFGTAVWVSCEEMEAFYDPASGELTNGLGPIYNRTVWLAGTGDEPVLRWDGGRETSRYEVRVELSWDAETECFKGEGYLSGKGGLCPYSRMAGLGGEAQDFFASLAGAFVPGAKIDAYNTTRFDPFEVNAGFELEGEIEKDKFDRVALAVGDPPRGVFEMLPGDVRLYTEKRDSPVYLEGVQEQVVEVVLDTRGLEVISLPREAALNNDAGSFRLKVTRDGDRIRISRELKLAKQEYSAVEWPQLRALLLAERSVNSRTILLGP